MLEAFHIEHKTHVHRLKPELGLGFARSPVQKNFVNEVRSFQVDPNVRFLVPKFCVVELAIKQSIIQGFDWIP